eukprot:3202273-Rhodomonas_salina.3
MSPSQTPIKFCYLLDPCCSAQRLLAGFNQVSLHDGTENRRLRTQITLQPLVATPPAAVRLEQHHVPLGVIHQTLPDCIRPFAARIFSPVCSGAGHGEPSSQQLNSILP